MLPRRSAVLFKFLPSAVFYSLSGQHRLALLGALPHVSPVDAAFHHIVFRSVDDPRLLALSRNLLNNKQDGLGWPSNLQPCDSEFGNWLSNPMYLSPAQTQVRFPAFPYKYLTKKFGEFVQSHSVPRLGHGMPLRPGVEVLYINYYFSAKRPYHVVFQAQYLLICSVPSHPRLGFEKRIYKLSCMSKRAFSADTGELLLRLTCAQDRRMANLVLCPVNGVFASGS